MKNKILFNALLYAPDGAGISRYTENLIKQYIENNVAIDILLREEFRTKFPKMSNLIFIDGKLKNSKDRIITEQWKLRHLYNQYKLIHFPDYATPIFTTSKTIATIHDLAMLSMRKMRTLQQNIVKNILLYNTIKRASGIICDSQFTKSELINYYPKLNMLNEVIYLGVDLKKQINFDESILERLHLSKHNYCLYVGTLAPHKNILNLIYAFSKLKEDGYHGKLVIAGAKGWQYEAIFSAVHKLELENEVIFTGYVTETELESLYKNTSCLVNISLYEGFGLPPLEAMLRGVPVVVSRIPVFCEVVGNCGYYCDPHDIDNICIAIKNMVYDPDIRKVYAKQGIERAQIYTWEQTAAKTIKFYKQVLNLS